MASRKVARRSASRTSHAASQKRTDRPARSLAAVVGTQAYAVWVEMLKTLVPHGRTHRLSVIVAGMLQHATTAAYRTMRGKPARGSVAASLLSASEGADSEKMAGDLGDVLTRLFQDAKVSPGRVNARRERYSITDSALHEFITWENMPWE